MRELLTFLLILTGIGGLFAIARVTDRFKNRGMLVWQGSYQLFSLVMAIALLWLNRLIHSDYRSALNRGELNATTNHFAWLGLPNGTSWNSAFGTFVIFPLVITTVVVYFQILKKENIGFASLIKVLPWAVVLAGFNSLTEEVIFRVIGIEGLSSTLSVSALAILSGVWFGIPHYFGTPGRIPGVLMAGFLGWVAAISILETGGIAVAWTIHFVQDVPIIVMLLAVAVKEASN